MENKYINHSGGCSGSDMFWETEGYKYGVETIAYSFPGHKQYGKNPKILNSDELFEGYNQCKIASKSLKRPLYKIEYNPYVRNLISRNWFQVKNADVVYAVGTFFDTNKRIVNGGTGWAIQMAIDNRKRVYFFDQDSDKWYLNLLGKFVEIYNIPLLSFNFAGIGTRELKENGEQAIIEIYKKTFENGNRN